MRTRPWCPPPLRHPPAQVVIGSRSASVLSGVFRGLSNREIGRELFISEDTVKTHVRRLFRLFGAANRAHAVALVASGRVRVDVREDAWSS